MGKTSTTAKPPAKKATPAAKRTQETKTAQAKSSTGKAATQRPKTTKETQTKKPADSGEMVVFAMRLLRSERELIHKVAGSGKATQYVRGLAVAAANGDMKAVQGIVQGTAK